jgi:radical SAM superfamily enzyme YgiQ (UPF0313 family)
MTGQPRAALIYPPVTDPTSGYHSLSYLDAYARSRGHAPADIVDANVEAFHYTCGPAGVAWLDRAWAERGTADYGDYLDPVAARAHLLRVADPEPDGVRDAVSVLRDPERFYRYEHYRPAADAVIAWMNCLGATAFPGQFHGGFGVMLPGPMLVGSAAALTDQAALARLSRPFQPYYEDVLLPRLAAGRYDVVGVNITYLVQLPFALWLIRLLRRALPDAYLVAGGTEVSDVWKYARDKAVVFDVFRDLDAIVVGEGETAYTEILDALTAGRVPDHPNVRTHPRYGARRSLPVLRYEPLADLPTPDFTGLPWDLYLSPERFVYYAPTRGCYWNKCTFCDYGLNTDGPTSPWRQSTVDKMVRDVTALSRSARFIYFSVDVLAPATILRFAEAVVEHGLDIRWGAEIRLEKYWSDERCELLRRSGCVAVSVGLESGSQRILDLIDKGTTPAQVRRTMAAMTRAGIGVQVMGFTGFPTETAAEARQTIDFLLDNRDLWTFGGLGDFTLTAGAIVAKQPDRFGVTDVAPLPGADISWTLGYTEPVSQAAREEVALAKVRSGLADDRYERPWVGATDSPHSYFYYDRYGTGIRAALRPYDPDGRYVCNGTVLEHPDDDTLAAYQRLYGRAGRDLPPGRVLFRRADGNLLVVPPAVRDLLAVFAEPRHLADAGDHTWMLDEAATDRLWRLLIDRGMLRAAVATPVAA